MEAALGLAWLQDQKPTALTCLNGGFLHDAAINVIENWKPTEKKKPWALFGNSMDGDSASAFGEMGSQAGSDHGHMVRAAQKSLQGTGSE